MASQSDEALNNPWAASPSPSPAPEGGVEQQQLSYSGDTDDDATQDRDVWRRSGSSDEGGSKAFNTAAATSTAQLSTAFDEFDPFRPDKQEDPAGISSSSSNTAPHAIPARDEEENADESAPRPASEGTPPATPSKTRSATYSDTGRPVEAGPPGSPTDEKRSQAVPQYLSGSPAASSSPRKTKEQPKSVTTSGTNTTSPPKTSSHSAISPPSTTSSALSNPLATIASAFRKRDFSSSGTASGSASKDATRSSTPLPPSSSSANASTSGTGQQNPPLPIGKPAPVILIRDNDENMLIDESEKEAPPAVPSHSLSHISSSSNNREDDNNMNAKEGQGGMTIEEIPFDFNFFLEQMRYKSSEPIAKYLRSFLREFGKKMWNVNDQIRVINDFLDFIAIKMRENEVWKNDSEREFDNAVEGMEKLVMNRVFHLTFVPALEPAQQATTQTDDLERDHVLSQRIKLFQWVSEEHLDLPQHKDTASFVEFAKQELRKINTYKAPRDKLICILNSCKVIFGLMRHLNLEDGADTFIPFLILVVLRANPDHLISNVQYIQRFRNPDRLAGENGYYLSSLNAAISFIETMDASSLSNITQEEFEKNVENAVRDLPPDDEQQELPAVPQSASASTSERQAGQSTAPTISRAQSIQQTSLPNSPSKATHRPMNEKRLSHQTSESSLYAHHQQPPPRSQSPAEATKEFFLRSSDNLQKTVSKPLQALGKIFTEMGSESEMIAGFPAHGHQHTSTGGPSSAQGQSANRLQQQPLSPHTGHQPTPRGQRPPSLRTRSTASLASPISPQARSHRLPPAGAQPGHYAPGYIANVPHEQSVTQHGTRPGPGESRGSNYQAADFLDDSVPAEEVQATVDKNYQATFNAKIDTLVNIFSGIERETLEIVLLSNGEDVERTIEGLLDMQ